MTGPGFRDTYADPNKELTHVAADHGHGFARHARCFCEPNSAARCDYSYVPHETNGPARFERVVRSRAAAAQRIAGYSWLRLARLAAAAMIVGGAVLVAWVPLVRPTIVTHLFALAVGTLFGAGMRVLDARASLRRND